MINKTLNLGTYRGNPRLWIEGNDLLKMGWIAGTRYNPYINQSDITLVINEEGKRKVAGNKKRQVIELTGKYMVELFKGYSKADICITEHAITIVPTNPQPPFYGK